MTLLLPIIAVFVVGCGAAHFWLPRASASRRLNVLFVAKWALALAFACLAAQGQPVMWVFAVLFAIFAWRTKAGHLSSAG
jgi:hypothetical protein